MLSQPPYALAPTMFRFRALASLAGHLPLGGERELAMAVFVAARLAADAIGDGALSEPLRKRRAAGAKHWLGALTLPAASRAACTQLIEATVKPQHEILIAALERVAAAIAAILDPPSRAELRQLAVALRAT